MSETQLESFLRNFDRVATLVGDHGARQIWRFEFNGRGYLLHFYPRRRGLHRLRRGGSAILNFIHLQALQRGAVPSTRAVAHLSGFRIGDVLGDALIVEAIPNSQPLNQYLQDCELRGLDVPRRADVARQLVDIVEGIGRAKLGDRHLTLDRFIIADGRVHLADAGGLRGGGMRLNDILTLAHDASRFATRTELLRAWKALNPDNPFPRSNPLSPSLWRRAERDSRGNSDRVGTIQVGPWSGLFTRSSKHPVPWSLVSRLTVERREWETAWPILLAQIESDQLTPIKRDASGEVLGGEVILGGKPVSVIVKHPKRKQWYRYLTDAFRPTRARRMWTRASMLIARDLPCEWPLLIMQRQVLGYVIDAVIVFERVPGVPLAEADLDSLFPNHRQMLFHRAGRTLRRTELSGLAHCDAKSTNWIVYPDPARGPVPVIVDVDGVCPLTFWLQGRGILRLLRAMKLHRQYTPADSLALCQGFSPYAGTFVQEQSTEDPE